MNDHTPTPWRVGDAGTAVFGPKTDSPSPVTVAKLQRASGAYSANAAFIVRACNAHDELVEAVGVALDIVAAEKEACGIYKAHIEIMRAALAKATE